MIEGLKPYPQYQPTSLLGLTSIPAHWSTPRLKTLFREVDNRSLTGQEELLSVSHKTGVTPRSEKNVTMFLAESNVGHKVCKAGDVVVNTMWAWMAAVGVAPKTGIVSPAYGVYRQTLAGSYHPRYLDLLLRIPSSRDEYIVRSRGITLSRLRLYPDQFLQMVLPVPPPDEQAAIVRFIDHADRRIRRLIGVKQKLIKLLEEQKRVIVHKAVTRGLDPSVPMKDSGIEWLGVVPTDWSVVALRRHWSVIDCKHVTVPFVDEGIPLASVREAQAFDLRLHSANRTTQIWFEKLVEGGRRPRVGDLVYCRNVSVGAAAYVDSDTEFAMGQDVCIIRSDDMNQRWLNYYLRSHAMALQLSMILVGSTFNRINVADIKALLVPVPPRVQQDSIAEHLDEVFEVFEAGRKTATREIDLLRELRTRLISDVVTGQLDVRAAAAALSEAIPDDESLDDEEDPGEDEELSEDPTLEGDDA